MSAIAWCLGVTVLVIVLGALLWVLLKVALVVVAILLPLLLLVGIVVLALWLLGWRPPSRT